MVFYNELNASNKKRTTKLTNIGMGIKDFRENYPDDMSF